MFIFLLASIFISAVGVASDDIQTIKDIVENANNFLKEHNMTVLSLSNIEVTSTGPIIMRKGTLEGLDTMEVLGDPIVKKKKNPDGSTTYMFFVNFVLKELSFHYDFESTTPAVSEGEVWLVPQEHLLEAAGIFVLGDNVCDARLYTIQLEKFGPLTIYISPKDLPGKGNLTETILKLIPPKLFDVTNAAFESETLYQKFQALFSDFICLQLKPKY